jgi:hypothetical protein
MKRIDAYQCELCEMLHDTEENAGLCEASHAKNLEVAAVRFEPGRDYPAEIEVRWTDKQGRLRGGTWVSA